MLETAYKTLRLDRQAGPEEVRAAYVRLDRRYPPEHFPEDLVLSVRRAMGSDRLFRLGDKDFRPEKISALILAHIRDQAARAGEIVERVVITVPAYFSDAQRRATLEAGRLDRRAPHQQTHRRRFVLRPAAPGRADGPTGAA